MKKDRQYKIDIFGLKIGSHDFSFEFDETIFENDEMSLTDLGKGTCEVSLNKKETLISMDFQIKGSIKLVCDRTLEPFDFELNISENLNLKYGEEFDDSRDDLWIIPDTQESINIESSIYEFVSVAVPMKKLHPKFENSEDEEGLEFVYSSEDEDPVIEEQSEVVDPRWEALKNIKNLEN